MSFWKTLGNIGSNIVKGVLSPVTSILGIGEGIYNSIAQAQQFDYQKDLQQQIFAREDNAVQRRIADLQKAGLSKTLAAGSSAGAGSVVQTQAPQSSVFDRVLMAMNLQKTKAEIEQVKADAANKQAQAGLVRAQTSNVTEQTALLQVRTALEQNKVDMLPITNAQQRQALINAREQAKTMAEQRFTSATERQRVWAQIDNIKSMTDLNRASIQTKELMYPILEAQLAFQLTKNSIEKWDYDYMLATGMKPGTGGLIGNLGGVIGYAGDRMIQGAVDFVKNLI